MYKNWLRYILAFTIVLGVIILSTGCSVQEKIIGKWIQRDGDLTYEFFRDGTFIGESGGTSLAGEYKIVGDNHLILQIGGMTSDNQFTIEGDVLTVRTIFSNEPVIFDREKP